MTKQINKSIFDEKITAQLNLKSDIFANQWAPVIDYFKLSIGFTVLFLYLKEIICAYKIYES